MKYKSMDYFYGVDRKLVPGTRISETHLIVPCGQILFPPCGVRDLIKLHTRERINVFYLLTNKTDLYNTCKLHFIALGQAPQLFFSIDYLNTPIILAFD
jgi:hypothetical protein